MIKNIKVVKILYLLFALMMFWYLPIYQLINDYNIIFNSFISIVLAILIVISYLVFDKYINKDIEIIKIDKKTTITYGIIMILGVIFSTIIKIYFQTYLSGIQSVNQNLNIIEYENDFWMSILHTIILAPIIEEVYFRKLLMSTYSNVLNSKTLTTGSVIFSSIIFMYGHIRLGANIGYALLVLLVGIILGVIYKEFGSIKLNILVHMVLNASSLIFYVF